MLFSLFAGRFVPVQKSCNTKTHAGLRISDFSRMKIVGLNLLISPSYPVNVVLYLFMKQHESINRFIAEYF